METKETAFRPAEHGWPFGNSYLYSPEMAGVRLPLRLRMGFCGGMVFCALDHFYQARPIPAGPAAPAQGEALFAELFRRQRQTLRGGVWIKTYRWQVMPDEELGAATAREWEAVRRSIDAGNPAVVCLIRAAGYLGKVWDNHQVVAWGYARDPATGRAALQVYDPNHPRRSDVRVEFTPGPRLEGRQSTGEPMRGFFVIPYDRPTTAFPHTASAE